MKKGHFYQLILMQIALFRYPEICLSKRRIKPKHFGVDWNIYLASGNLSVLCMLYILTQDGETRDDEHYGR